MKRVWLTQQCAFDKNADLDSDVENPEAQNASETHIPQH